LQFARNTTLKGRLPCFSHTRLPLKPQNLQNPLSPLHLLLRLLPLQDIAEETRGEVVQTKRESIKTGGVNQSPLNIRTTVIFVARKAISKRIAANTRGLEQEPRDEMSQAAALKVSLRASKSISLKEARAETRVKRESVALNMLAL